MICHLDSTDIFVFCLVLSLAFGSARSLSTRPQFRHLFGFGNVDRNFGRHPWFCWIQLTFSKGSDFSMPVACVSLASRALALDKSPSSVRTSLQRAYLQRHFDWQFWMMADLRSVHSELPVFQSSGKLINCFSSIMDSLSKLKSFVIHIFFGEKYSFSFVMAVS